MNTTLNAIRFNAVAAFAAFLLLFLSAAGARPILRPVPACNNPSEWGSQPRQHRLSQETDTMTKPTTAKTAKPRDMKHKRAFTDLALELAAKTADVANRLAEDGEEPLSDTEGRIFLARAIKRLTPVLIATALRAEEDEVRTALTEAQEEAAKAAAEDTDEAAEAEAATS